MAIALLADVPATAGAADEGIILNSPGLAPSRLDPTGALVEDWGALRLVLSGDVVTAPTNVELAATKLDALIPAARARSLWGPVQLDLTAYRAPAWPAGVDVVEVRLTEMAGRDVTAILTLETPPGATLGARTVSAGSRTILSLPTSASLDRPEREWGYADEATSLPGWARPQGDCDPAYRNIRAGMGGVPIVYRFPIAPGGTANVVLGLCESHWAQAGQRPVVCRVEGAPTQTVDPIARWGQHKPGALAFAARDTNGDGRLSIVVAPVPGAPDTNPILNVIWVFPPTIEPDLPQVITGKLNDKATWYVDVGGEKDQSIYPPGKLQFSVALPAHGSKDLTFLVACPGSSAPVPSTTAWTEEGLRKAALAVWREWKEAKP